jgi:hypothetical protein
LIDDGLCHRRLTAQVKDAAADLFRDDVQCDYARLFLAPWTPFCRSGNRSGVTGPRWVMLGL